MLGAAVGTPLAQTTIEKLLSHETTIAWIDANTAPAGLAREMHWLHAEAGYT